jgi:transposase
LAEIKDIKKFATKSKLIAFAGTDPAVRQSGSSLHSNGRISKKGSKSLRRYLYLMASGVMKFNDYFRAYYDKKKTQGMQHRKAMIALVNKLLKTIFALLTKKEFFVMPNFAPILN